MRELIRKILREQFLSNKEDFINKARKIHGQKYDYSDVNYITSNKKVKIKCPEHGYFEQTPASHLSGRGCRECGIERRNKLKTIWTKEKISHEAQKYTKRGEFQKNSPVAYQVAQKKGWLKNVTSHMGGKHEDWTKEKIIKLAKGIDSKSEFADLFPNAHMAAIRNGWWEEISSQMTNKDFRGEKLIRTILENNKIKFDEQKKFLDCVSKRGKYCKRLPFDFYLTDYNTLIEYDGRQHFQPVYGEEQLKIQNYIDNLKNLYCDNNNIKLIRIPYTMSPEEIEIYLLMELGITD